MPEDTLSDPIRQLQNDHREVESLFQQFQTGSVDFRTEVLRKIVRELSIHGAIEEQVVYPAMRRYLEDGDAKVEHSIADHQAMKEILKSLDGASADEEGVPRTLQMLMADVRSHVQEEENELLPQLRTNMPPVQYTEMATAMQVARQAAPTRPHPKAPASSGPAAAVAGAAASIIDKARDAVRDLTSRKD